METIPSILTFKGKDYILEETHFSKHIEILPGWWSFMYTPLDSDGLPPYVHNKHEWYFLCTTAPTKEEALADLTERVTTMILD